MRDTTTPPRALLATLLLALPAAAGQHRIVWTGSTCVGAPCPLGTVEYYVVELNQNAGPLAPIRDAAGVIVQFPPVVGENSVLVNFTPGVTYRARIKVMTKAGPQYSDLSDPHTAEADAVVVLPPGKPQILEVP